MITRLPCRFTNLFTYWLYCDGYRPQVKKDAVVMRRGDSVLKIFCHKGRMQQDYLMNEACQRKFQAILWMLLKRISRVFSRLRA